MLQNLVVLLVLLSDWTVASPRSPAIRRVQVSGLQATIDRTRFLLDFATEYAPEKKEEKSLKREDKSSENYFSNSRPEDSSNPPPDTRNEDPADPTGDTSAEPPEDAPEAVSVGATGDPVTSNPGVSSGAIVGIIFGGIVVLVGAFLAGRRTRDSSRSSPPSPASKPVPVLKVGSSSPFNVESPTDLDVPSQSATDLDGPTESSDVHDMPSRRDEV